jgi:sarcosine oxidase subunit beta
MSTRRIVIIGGGVIGLNVAYQLAQRNAGKITLLEKDSIGDGASLRAAGIGTHLMWSETGVLARKIGFSLFRSFGRDWNDFAFHDEQGCLNMIAKEAWPARESLLSMYDRLDVPYEVLSAGEIRHRWPALQPHPGHIGLFDPLGGYSEPTEFVPALTKRVRELGVEIVVSEAVEEFLLQGDAVVGVRCKSDVFHADAVVSAVHAWSLPLWRDLGLRLPMKQFIHQRYLSRPLAVPFTAPAINADPYLGYIRPAAGNRILMGVETTTREEYRVESSRFNMDELRTPPGICEETQQRFLEFVPALNEVQWENEKVGLISLTMDGEPLLGPVKRLPGLFVATAFHSGGYSYSPVAGYLLAELIAEGTTSIDLSPFAPDRFTASETEEHLAITIPQCQAIRRRH